MCIALAIEEKKESQHFLLHPNRRSPNKPNQDYEKQAIIISTLNLNIQELREPIIIGGRANLIKTAHYRKKSFSAQ